MMDDKEEKPVKKKSAGGKVTVKATKAFTKTRYICLKAVMDITPEEYRKLCAGESLSVDRDYDPKLFREVK